MAQNKCQLACENRQDVWAAEKGCRKWPKRGHKLTGVTTNENVGPGISVPTCIPKFN